MYDRVNWAVKAEHWSSLAKVTIKHKKKQRKCIVDKLATTISRGESGRVLSASYQKKEIKLFYIHPLDIMIEQGKKKGF